MTAPSCSGKTIEGDQEEEEATVSHKQLLLERFLRMLENISNMAGMFGQDGLTAPVDCRDVCE